MKYKDSLVAVAANDSTKGLCTHPQPPKIRGPVLQVLKQVVNLSY